MLENALQSRVLVLNRSFMPIQITSAKRAFCMIYLGIAKAVDREYQTFDFESWAQLQIRQNDQAIGMIGKLVKIPRVILLQVYDRMPKKQIRFSRYNIFARDKNICQYCGKRFFRVDLNLDHVIPRSRGGETTWENIVCSCIACNRKKGGRTPKEASMKLVKIPKRPHWTECLNLKPNSPLLKEWLPFLNVVDFSYWTVELEK
ncbi:MAG: HNH endonuclease [Bdellovibrionales bacterium]|nr:HNH endonuclease [Bdellovibrionales bacterium]